LIVSALEEAFRDMRRNDTLWIEYSLPIIRFSLFCLGWEDEARRACQEIMVRWGWSCDYCRRDCDGEAQMACKSATR
jgi:hypothetical protein